MAASAVATYAPQLQFGHAFQTAEASPLTRLRRAREDPEKLDVAAVRVLGRACLERSFISLDDAQLLVACLAQLDRADDELSASLCSRAAAVEAERAARRVMA